MGGWELGREENYRKMHHLLALGNSKHWDSRKDKCPELYVMPLFFEEYGGHLQSSSELSSPFISGL